MTAEDIEELRKSSNVYGQAVDIVSNFQFWSQIQAQMSATVRHFERFPRVSHPDTGNELTPDFTILFNDGTALIGEIARQARHRNSFESLWAQIEAYACVSEVPASDDGEMAEIEIVDALVVAPFHVSNQLCGNIREKQEAERTDLPIRVFEFGVDPTDGIYTFKCPSADGNLPPRGNGRDPSFESWLDGSADGLRGLPKNFSVVNVQNRFMNDEIPPMYLAKVLWSEVFGQMAAGPADLSIKPGQLAEEMREVFGVVRSTDIRKALELLAVARLAEKAGSKWNVGYHELGKSGQDLENALVSRLNSPPKGPITHSEKQFIAAGKAAEVRNKQEQGRLELEE